MGCLFSIVCACLALAATAAIAAPQHKRTGAAVMRPADGVLAGLHELRREGNLTCMVDHTHSGASAG